MNWIMIVRRHTLYPGVLACAAFVFAGCTPAPSNPPPPQPLVTPGQPQVDVQTQAPVASKPPAATEPLKIGGDSSETRLQDMCGPLLLYLSIYQKFPDKLEDLRSLPDLDKNADFTSPITHQPYGYVQNGLPMPDHKGGILVYDREPHNGVRWAIEIIWPDGTRIPLALVIPLTDQAFQALNASP